MPAPYSVDLRKRVVAAYKPDETSYESIAEQFSVGVASVNRWLQKKRKTGSVEPAAHAGGPVRRIDADGEKLLLVIVGQMPDLTLGEIAERYAAERGVQPKIPTLQRALVRLGLTRKKKRSSPPSARATRRASSAGTSSASDSKSSSSTSSSSTKVGSTSA